MMRAKLSTCVLLLVTACHLHAAGMPASGLSMRAVEQEFGAPLKKNAPVGQPPITRWEYNGFVVVFERSTVVQSVETPGNTPAHAAAPRPAPVTPAAPVVRAPAPAATPAPAPAAVAAKPAVVQPDTAEIERQAKEREAMARAAADRTAAEKAEAAAKAATIAPAPVTPPPAAAPAAPEAAPAAPAPAVEEPKKPKGDGSYTFDPATGRIIIN